MTAQVAEVPNESHRLYRECQLWRGIAVLLGAVVLLTVSLGASPRVPEELKAKRFTVVDPNGRPAAQLSFDHGGPSLTLLEPTGTPRVRITSGYDTPTELRILDGYGTRMSVRRNLDDSFTVDLLDKAHTVRATLSLGTDGQPRFALQGPDGKPIWQVP